MKLDDLANYKRGWVYGNFFPTLLTKIGEVGCQSYDKGFEGDKHSHNSIEVNIVTSGHCRFHLFRKSDSASKLTYIIPMGSIDLITNDILILEPGEIAQFEALTNCTLTVLRDSSDPKDKIIYG